MRSSIATVCLSGTLVDKLHAIADAGFEAAEVFEPDLIAAPQSPEEIRALCERLGLELSLYQPFRDAEGVTEEAFAAVLRRAEAKFVLMERLGIRTVLVCSNVATASVNDDAVSAGQLGRLADRAAAHGRRIAFEALAWGRYIDDYRRAWRVVERADHPALGVCLDSFHILSRGHDPADIERIPGEKIFFAQLADAPHLTMDVLSWSRHHRLFPGEGGFDLAGFLGHVVRAGYDGPLSLEVFNDVFRQTDPARTARHARRSLRALEDAAGVTPAPTVAEPRGIDYVEIKAEQTDGLAAMLERLGFAMAGEHGSKQARLWKAGDARIVLNEHDARAMQPHVAGFGLLSEAPRAAAARAHSLGAERAYRRVLAGEADLPGLRAPDGTEILLSGPDTADAWPTEFTGGRGNADPGIGRVDHLNLTQPASDIDEAIQFYRAAIGLSPHPSAELSGPIGLVRSQVLESSDGAVRLALNVAPLLAERDTQAGGPANTQHVAFSCSDLPGLLERARGRGLRTLPVSANYYDDLAARVDLPSESIAALRAAGLLYDRDDEGEYLHCYTETIGAVFFELVERLHGYAGYGAVNTSVRLTAQHTPS